MSRPSRAAYQRDYRKRRRQGIVHLRIACPYQRPHACGGAGACCSTCGHLAGSFTDNLAEITCRKCLQGVSFWVLRTAGQ